MTFDEYQDLAELTIGPDASPLMLGLGVGGECGEVLEIIKKGNRPNKSVDIEHLHEEIGDVLWYLTNLAGFYGLDMSSIAEANIEKLNKRYGSASNGV